MSAAVLAHLGCELIAVRIVVAVDAALRFQLEVVMGALALMTGRAGDRLVFAIQRELGPAVLLHREQGWPESLFVVARFAIDNTEATPMHVLVAVPALIELEPTIASLNGNLGGVAASASNLPMQSL